MPTTPNLIHPIPVTIELLDFTKSVMRDRFGEPVGGPARPTQYVVPGQVFDQDTINNPIESGLKRTVEGYVAFRVVDMQRILPRRIQRMDKIVKFGTANLAEVVDFYIYRIRRRMHYAHGSTVCMCWYRDRTPISTEGTLHKDNF
jgi:hypothetical protein